MDIGRIIIDYLSDLQDLGEKYWQFAIIGVVIAVVGLVYLLFFR